MIYPNRTATPHDRYASISKMTIELQSHCNRDCPFCPRFLDRSGERKDAGGASVLASLETDRVYWVLDEMLMGGFKGWVAFHRLSEPLLDKRYLEFAEYAASKGLKVIDSTNGDVLKQNARLAQKLDGVVHTFHVGLYDYMTYEEKAAEMAYWEAKFTKTRVYFSTPYENMNPRQFSETYEGLFKDERVLDAPCPAARDQLRVNYNGEVHLCCQDDYGSFRLGNVFEDGIDHVMFSARRRQINDDLNEHGGRRKHELCSKCYFGGVPEALKSPEDTRKDKTLRRELRQLRRRFEGGEIMLPEVTESAQTIRRAIYDV